MNKDIKYMEFISTLDQDTMDLKYFKNGSKLLDNAC